jgi:DNA-directed RNA polymerase subunit RPC12/RpoP
LFIFAPRRCGFAGAVQRLEKTALLSRRECEMFPAASAMSEFKYACPVCGQHMKCDSSQSGSVMDCPTCFQKIVAPQAPTSDDPKFILTGSKFTEKKIPDTLVNATAARSAPEKSFPLAIVIVLALVVAAGAAAFVFRGKLFRPGLAAWQAIDVGSVGAAGSFSQSAGVFTVTGSGADIWRQADGFQFVHQSLAGDSSLTARVLNVKTTEVWTKTGVMIRETTNADSMFALAYVRADGKAQFQWRNATGQNVETSPLVGDAGYPKWLKIVRNGNSFSGFYKVKAEDGWTQIGAAPTVEMAPTAQIGLFVCSHRAGTLSTAQFDQVTLQADKK